MVFPYISTTNLTIKYQQNGLLYIYIYIYIGENTMIIEITQRKIE